MKRQYKILVHFASVESPAKVTASVLKAWSADGRPPVKQAVASAKSGKSEAFEFDDNTECLSAEYRTATGKHGETIELFFANPHWKYSKPRNSCAIYLAAENVQNDRTGYSQSSILDLLSRLIDCAEVRSAVLDSIDVLYSDEVDELERKRKSPLMPTLLYWMTYIPYPAKKMVLDYIENHKSECCVLRDLGKRGLIASVQYDKSLDHRKRIARLERVNKGIGVI